MNYTSLYCVRPVAALVALLASLQAASADTTVQITGIGTSVTDAGFMINTHVDSVTYAYPVEVMISGIPVIEIRGTVSGVGWGGTGIVARATNAHYHYDMPFVARWRKHGASHRLVFYQHGGGNSVIAAVKRDKLVGAANPNRFAELNGDQLVGVGALLDHAAFVSINRRGLRGDGTFSATYVAPVAPLTAVEVAAIKADLASAPGDPNFVQPGIAAEAAVPVLPTNDAPTCRDVARALEKVLADFQNHPFDTRIAVGVSSGARLLGAMNFGRSIIGTNSVRTGGNHIVPYDKTSKRIFDGFILNGFPYAAGVAQVDTAQPLSAPTMLVQGQGDERYQQHVTLAHELLQKGVTLNRSVWIYEVKNLTHVTRDNPYDTTQPSDGDRLGAIMSAATLNLRKHIEEASPPPLSRMAGRIVGGTLRFDQAGGTTTNMAPVLNDLSVDSFVVDVNLTPRFIGSDETTRWLAVTAALPHDHDAITPPTVACRLGGYRLMFFGAQLTPFSKQVLATKYGGFERFRDSVNQAVAALERDRLYDPRVESGNQTAERFRALFATDVPTPVEGCPRILFSRWPVIRRY